MNSSDFKQLKKQKSESDLPQNTLQVSQNTLKAPQNTWKIDCFNNKYASFILPGLYLGSLVAATDENWLKKHKITHILTVADSITPSFPELFTYKVILIRDHPLQNISQHFDEIYEFIQNVLDQEDGNILVHCHQGVSRSASAVIAYIMRSQQIPLNDAIKIVKKKRSAIRPNKGFIQQLKLFESTISVTSYIKNSSDNCSIKTVEQ